MSKLPPTAIFGFDDSGMLEIYRSPGEVVMACEGIDAESDMVRFYDAKGASLMPEFITPNRSGSILGLFRWIESGIYRLVPSDKIEDSFALALFEARGLQKNEWYDSIDQLKSDLRSDGIDVDFHP